MQEKFTSTDSYIKKSSDDDTKGNYVLGETLVKQINDNTKATLVAYSNAFFATNYTMQVGNSYTYPIYLRNNKDLLLNTIAYLSDREDSISIRKQTGTEYVSFETASGKQDLIVRIIIFAIPLVLIITGIIISIVRKRKK